MLTASWCRWIAGIGMAAVLVAVPFVFYRYDYTLHKRLRPIVPGRIYRSGQMTAPGFADAAHTLHLRTIINLQDDYPDPDIAVGYFTNKTIKESELCRQLGVRYRFLPPDLISRRLINVHRPRAIDAFLDIMDDPNTYPVLIHCRAGLNRTGCLAAVYHMEYEHWTPDQAIADMKEQGFGSASCTSANDYITQYVLTYRPGIRNQIAVGLKPLDGSRFTTKAQRAQK